MNMKGYILATQFIDKYLTRLNHDIIGEEAIDDAWHTMVKEYNQIDKPYFKEFIYKNYRSRDSKKAIKLYEKYCGLKYWKIISYYIRKERNICEFSDNCDNTYLEVHHRTYKILGSEIDNQNKLLCLCSVCHPTHHKNTARHLPTKYESNLKQKELEDALQNEEDCEIVNINISKSIAERNYAKSLENINTGEVINLIHTNSTIITEYSKPTMKEACLKFKTIMLGLEYIMME